MFLINFPLMLVPFAVYNFFILAQDRNPWEDVILRTDLWSGAEFTLSMGEALIVLSLVLLFLEVLKAARAVTSPLADHLLSALVLVAFIAEFFTIDKASTPTFFLIGVIAFVDVICGLAIPQRHGTHRLQIEP